MTKRITKAELAKTYRRVFGTEDGQTVLADIMRAAGVYTVPETNDPGVLAADRGRREIAMHIGLFLTYKPETFVRDQKKTLEQMGYADWIN